MAKELKCLYDDGEYLAGKSTIIITSNNNGSNKSPFQLSFKYLTAILNSKLISFWYRNNFRFSSLAGGYLTISKDRVERIPIPPITDQNQPLVSKIESLVDQILAITKQKDYDPDSSAEETQKVKELESQIDELVYQLYGLKPDEIAIIESEIKSNNQNNNENNKKKRNKKGEQEDYEA